MKLLKFFGWVLSLGLTIVFFGVSIVFVSGMFTKNMLKEETIYKYIEEVDVLSLKAGDFVSGNKDDTLESVLVTKLSDIGVPRDISVEVINNDKLTKLISKKISAYAFYVLADQEKPILSKNDFEQIINISMTDDQYKAQFDNFLSSLVETANDSLPDKDEIFIIFEEVDGLQEVEKYTNFIFSNNFIYLMIGIFILIFLLIGLCRWSLYKPFSWIGTSTVILGMILMISYLIQLVAVRYIIKASGSIESIITKAINVVFKDILIMGGIIFVVGIVMLIINAICKKIFDKEEEIIFDEPKRIINTNEETV